MNDVEYLVSFHQYLTANGYRGACVVEVRF